MTAYEMWTLVLQGVVAIAAFATLWLLYHQLKLMSNQLVASQDAARASAALSIVAHLQAPDVRAARAVVRGQLSTKPRAEWTQDECGQASLVCANYDVAGALLRADLAPAPLFIANWGPSIRHCHQVLRPYVEDLRAKPGADRAYWSNFDWLNEQVVAKDAR